MRFKIQGRLEAPAREAMRHYHGRLEHVAARLDNVARVEVLERSEERTRLKWFAQGDIPRAFHRVISPEDLFWEDDTVWDFESLELGSKAFRPGSRKLRCEVRVRLEDDEEGRATYHVEGDLRIDLPMFGAMLERFFVGQVEANMRAFYKLLEQDVREAREAGAPSPEAPAREEGPAP